MKANCSSCKCVPPPVPPPPPPKKQQQTSHILTWFVEVNPCGITSFVEMTPGCPRQWSQCGPSTCKQSNSKRIKSVHWAESPKHKQRQIKDPRFHIPIVFYFEMDKKQERQGTPQSFARGNFLSGKWSTIFGSGSRTRNFSSVKNIDQWPL